MTSPQKLQSAVQPISKSAAHDIAERSLLGRLMTLGEKDKANTAFEQVSDLKPSDFGTRKHQLVWHAIKEIHTRGDGIKFKTIEAELNRPLKSGNMSAITEVGIEYLEELSTQRHADVLESAKLIRRASVRRKAKQASQEIQAIVENGSLSESQMAEKFVTIANTLSTQAQALDGHGPITMSLSLAQVWKTFDQKLRAVSAGDETTCGLSLGYTSFDDVLNGLKRGEMSIWAGGPGVGKSAWGVNLGVNVARAGGSVVFIPLEMTHQEMTQRALSVESSVRASSLTTGHISPEDMERLKESYTRMHAWQGTQRWHYLTFEAMPTIEQIETKLNQHIAQHGTPDLIILDQVSPEAIAPSNRNIPLHEFMSQTITRVKAWPTKYNNHVAVMAQLNRESDKQPESRPRMSSVAGSYSLVRAANVFVALWREKGKNQADCEPVEFIILKNRSGWEGTLHMSFIPYLTKYTEVQS